MKLTADEHRKLAVTLRQKASSAASMTERLRLETLAAKGEALAKLAEKSAKAKTVER